VLVQEEALKLEQSENRKELLQQKERLSEELEGNMEDLFQKK
jgi:hypothetical protein